MSNNELIESTVKFIRFLEERASDELIQLINERVKYRKRTDGRESIKVTDLRLIRRTKLEDLTSKWKKGIDGFIEEQQILQQKVTELQNYTREQIIEANRRRNAAFQELENCKKKLESWRERIERTDKFIDFCKNDKRFAHILDEFNRYLHLEQQRPKNNKSAPPVLPEQSLMKHYRIKY